MATTVDLKATIVRDIPEEGIYRVTMEIIDAVGIEFEVFVFDVETGLFSRVASVYDMQSYPAGRDVALYNGFAYYRARGGVKEYTQLLDATYFERVTKERLLILAKAWSVVTDQFTGESIYEARSRTNG